MMKMYIVPGKCLSATCLTIIIMGLTLGSELPNQPSITFQSFPLGPDFNASRVDALGKALDFDNWPQTKVRHVAPPIDKTLLSNPDLVTRQSTYYHAVPFGQDPWGQCNWSWRRLVKNTEPLPTDLPAERKSHLLEKMSPEKRNDPNFVEEYLKRKLDGYRMSKTYRLEGEMDVYLCIAPDSRAAQEYMLVIMTENTLPIEGVIGMYTHAKKSEGLGTVNYLTESTKKDDIRVKVVRDNISLNIRGNGCFADEVLPLARKIDAMLVKQPPLTYEQLMVRRPSITIDPDAIKSKTGEKTVSYNISAPAGQQIVDVKAYVNDRKAPVRNGKIHIIRKTGKVKVKVIATTSELLTNTFEKEVTVPE
jgi:hypothetical protein